MDLTKLSMYELIKKEELPEIYSVGYYLKHKKSGARIAVLENDDRNKVFCVSFRTPPKDDTGVAHIIEHTVLMGSERYPLKDPFNKLVNSSLNTYLNATTYPDKTMYPVASCNDKDFKNLMGVYMDAVFAPNVIKDDRAFKQEGWHYQLDSADSELQYNGVVYNEMKGAHSSVDRITYKEIMASIFPDTDYANESGGKVEAIPELSYEQFVESYKRLYHPTNSYIYLYGNANMEERLLWIDKEYLCKFDALEDISDTMPLWQEPFAEIREKRCTYSIMENEDEADKTNLCYVAAIDDFSTNVKLSYALKLVSYALVEAPGSPLEKALYDAGIGKLVYGSVDSMRQGFFSVVANNTNEDRKDEFVKIVMDTLKKIVSEGLNKKTLEAGLHNMEFSYREQDFGRWPGGLLICIGMMQSWLYDDDMIFDYYKMNDVFAELRELINTDYYEKLIEKYLINNKHAVVLTVAPEKGLINKQEKAIKDKLLAYQNKLSDAEKDKLVEETKALKAYQDEEDTPEALETLPRLLREDIDPKTHTTEVVEKKLSDGTKLLHSDLHTNGIGYVRLLFNTDMVPERLVQYIPMLCFIGKTDTTKRGYVELANEILCNTGGTDVVFNKYSSVKDTDCTTAITIKSRALYNKLPFAFDMMEEIMFDTDWTSDKRLMELLEENITGMSRYFNNSPHSMVYIRGLIDISRDMAYKEVTDNITYYRFLKEFTENFEKNKDEFVRNMNELTHMVFRPENLIVHFCGNDEGIAIIDKCVVDLKKKLFTDEVEQKKPEFSFESKNEGIKLATQVQYVGSFGNYRREGFDYSGIIPVAKNVLDADYLYQNIRAKGGAYGIITMMTRNGNVGFISYRDPRLEETDKVYMGIPEYLRKFEATEEEMTEYIIGVIGALDTPYTPRAESQRALDNYMSGLTVSMIQKSRDEILSTTAKDINEIADLFEAVLNNSRLCVAGNDEKIAASDMFDSIISVEQDS